MILDVLVGVGLAAVCLRWFALIALAGRRGRVCRPVGRPEPITVLIPAHDEAAVLRGTVEAVRASTVPTRILVIDDGSTDETAAVAAALTRSYAEVAVVSHPVNRGKAAALQTGLALADTELVATIDADTLPDPAALARLIAALQDGAAAAASTVKVLEPDSALTRWQHLEYVTAMHLGRRAQAACGVLVTVPGCLSAWRRSAVAEVGGFSGRTLAEDTDLTLTLQRAGHRVAFVDDAIAWTQAPRTVADLVRQRRRWLRGNLQCARLHLGALRDGPAGLRRLGLPDLWWTHLGVFLLAPLTLLWLPHGLVHFSAGQLVALGGLLWCVDALGAGVAVRLEREPARVLLSLPLQRLVLPWILWAAFAMVAVDLLARRQPRWIGVARRPIAPQHGRYI